jgi:hypothetical protein
MEIGGGIVWGTQLEDARNAEIRTAMMSACNARSALLAHMTYARIARLAQRWAVDLSRSAQLIGRQPAIARASYSCEQTIRGFRLTAGSRH